MVEIQIIHVFWHVRRVFVLYFIYRPLLVFSTLGCNECRVLIGTNTGIYATFVMTVVAQEDASRSIWPAPPADLLQREHLKGIEHHRL